MATDATTTPAQADRDAAIKAYTREQAAREAATARGDKAGALSHGAKAANRSREIREAELEMALAGTAFTPWEKPKTAKTRRADIGTEAEVAEKIAALRAVAKTAPFESVKTTAEQRIASLVKAARDRGYATS